MPPTHLPGGKKNTEKYIRAEQKNRLERTRLDLSQKFFDRESFKTKFRIEREKKLLSRAHDLVKRTSGHSDEGCPPRDEYDRDYERSVVFQNGIRLTNLRLTNWRIHEKELHSFLESVEKDMDNLAPGKFQNVRFNANTKKDASPNKQLKQDKASTKRKSVARSRSIDSSYQELSDYDDEDDVSSAYSDDSSQMTASYGGSSLRKGSTSTPATVRKHVTFLRPHTAGVLLKRPNSNQTPVKKEPQPEDTTHFLITKGGTLMNTNGTYKPIKTPNLVKKERPVTACSKIAARRRKTVNRLNFDQSFTSLESFRAEESARNRVFSPGSENSSISCYLPEAFKSKSAPSPIGNLPMRTNLPSGRPNSRLGIFLPPEKEFSKRQSFSHRHMFNSTGEEGHGLNSISQTNPWQNRLLVSTSSNVHIRSLGSVATVLRAALAFSKSRRRNILEGILNKNEKEQKSIVDVEKKRRFEVFTHAPDIDSIKHPT